MMSAHFGNVGTWLQGADLASPDSAKLVTFVGIIAVSLAFLALVVLGALIAAFLAYRKVSSLLHETHLKTMPVIASVQKIVEDARPKVASITENVRSIVEDVRPKVASVTENIRSIVEDTTPKVKAVTENVKTVAANFTDTTTTLKDKVREIADNVTDTVGDANKKTRAQVDRVDNMVNSAFTATSDVAAKIHHGIKVPVNEIVGWVNGVKAGLDKFLSHKKLNFGEKPSGIHVAPFKAPASAKQTVAPDYPPTASGEPAAPVVSDRPFASDRFQAAASRAAEEDILSDPSSAVAPSPGAQEVVDRFMHNSEKDEKPKPVY